MQVKGDLGGVERSNRLGGLGMWIGVEGLGEEDTRGEMKRGFGKMV